MAQRVKLTLNTAKVRAEEHAGAARGLALAAEHLLQVSRALVPIEEATLERSGTATVDRSRLEASVAYDTLYAVRQHEELTWRHDPGRQAKYLEEPAQAEREVLVALVAAEIRRSLK